MVRSRVIVISLGILAIAIVSTAEDLPSPTAPPSPGCDSYSMQALPSSDFKFQQKACFYRDQLFTGTAISGAAFSSAISEWLTHSPPEWPQGAEGYGMRFGTHYAQGMVKSSTTFLVGALLREDPRPLPPDDPVCKQMGKEHHHYHATGAWTRLGQSLLRVVWIHEENCTDRVAISRLAGSFASGFVQLPWQPDSQRNARTAFEGSATALGGYFAASVFSEFQGNLFGWVGKVFATGKPKNLPATTPPSAAHP